MKILEQRVEDIILDYKSRGSFCLNYSLFRENIIPLAQKWKEKEVELNESLNSLPPYNNQTVWRFENGLPIKEVLECLKTLIGKKVLFPQFLSTGKNKPNIPDAFYYKIKTSNYSNGRDIEAIGNGYIESEVLFKSKTVFRIIGNEQNDELEDIIIMEEIIEEPDIILFYEYWKNPLPQDM